MLKIKETEVENVTRICCPKCKEVLPRVGLRKESRIEGMTFKCRRCGKFYEVKTE